jgi:type IV pilus assembly protein PilW
MSSTIGRSRRSSSGFTLVEIMVALVIGLITVLVIMQATTATEAQRRQISGGSSADAAGAIALQTIQRAVLGAGAGMNGDSNAIFNVCYLTTVNASNAAAGLANIALAANSFSPIRIWDAAAPPAHLNAAGFDANTDIVQIIGGGSDFFFGHGVAVGGWAEPTNFAHIAGASIDKTWDPIAGLHSGDLTIVVEAGQACRISQITGLSNQGQNVLGETACDPAVANSATTGAQIKHGTVPFKNFHNGCRQEPSNWNGGTAFTGTNGMLYSLGSPDRFNMRAFAIRGGRLTVCAPLYQDCTNTASWEVFGDGIVSMKAQYGFDADNDQIVTAAEWTRASPAANWDRLKAFRMVLVARNKQMERDIIATADCAPVWAGYTTADATCTGAPAAGQVYLATADDGANWNRYRYKIFETTIPLRNLYWSN